MFVPTARNLKLEALESSAMLNDIKHSE